MMLVDCSATFESGMPDFPVIGGGGDLERWKHSEIQQLPVGDAKCSPYPRASPGTRECLFMTAFISLFDMPQVHKYFLIAKNEGGNVNCRT